MTDNAYLWLLKAILRRLLKYPTSGNQNNTIKVPNVVHLLHPTSRTQRHQRTHSFLRSIRLLQCIVFISIAFIFPSDIFFTFRIFNFSILCVKVKLQLTLNRIHKLNLRLWLMGMRLCIRMGIRELCRADIVPSDVNCVQFTWGTLDLTLGKSYSISVGDGRLTY